MAVKADDVCFWRHGAPSFVNGAPSTLAFSSTPELYGDRTNLRQRRDVQLVILYANSTVNAPSIGAGMFTGLNNTAQGRTVVVAGPVYRAGVDTDPGGVNLNAGTGSGLWSNMCLTQVDWADPFEAGGVLINSGVGTTITAPAVTLTERSRVVRFFATRAQASTPGAATPAITGHGEAWDTAANTTNGADFGYRCIDLGIFEAGETVAAQTCTIASGSWVGVTIPLKLTKGAPKIVSTFSGSSTTNLAIGAGFNAYADVGDHVFIFEGCSATPTNATNGYSDITQGGKKSTGAVWYKKMVGAVDVTTTISGTFAVGTVAVGIVARGLDPTTPYSVTTDSKTENPMIGPNGTVARTRDLAVETYGQVTGGSSVPSYSAFTPKGNMHNQSGASGSPNRQGLWTFIEDGATLGAPLSVGTLTPSSVTTNVAAVARLANTVILRAMPAIHLGAASLSLDLTIPGAVGAAFDLNVFGDAALELPITMTARGRTFKPRGRTPPRREYVWVRDLAGEQIGVIR